MPLEFWHKMKKANLEMGHQINFCWLLMKMLFLLDFFIFLNFKSSLILAIWHQKQMSDHPNEAERNLKRIFICDDIPDDIWHDTFRLLAPAKVGLALAFVSDNFCRLVDTQFRSRKWALGKLKIELVKKGNRKQMKIVKLNADGSVKHLPMPQIPTPNSVIGFEQIIVSCPINRPVIAFLRRIGHLFQSGITLTMLHSIGHNAAELNAFATSVWPLLTSDGIGKMHFEFPITFQLLRRSIRPFFANHGACFPNLRMISFDFANLFEVPPAADASSSSSSSDDDDQVLCKWLHTPRADGQPKVLKALADPNFPIEELKMLFLSATTAVSFIIWLRSFGDDAANGGQFELVNSCTRERLTGRRIGEGDQFLIERCPIVGKSADQRDELGREEAWKTEAEGRSIDCWKMLTFGTSFFEWNNTFS